jgi:hypothetical protein
VECDNLGITDLLPRAQGTKRRQPLQDRVGQLVSSQFEDDPLKLFRSNVPIAIFIKVSESLSETFTLEPLDELGEFRVCRVEEGVMSAVSTYRSGESRALPTSQNVTSRTTFPEVKFCPITVKVERCSQQAEITSAISSIFSDTPTENAVLTYAFRPSPDHPTESLLELIESDVPVVIVIKVLESDEVVGIGSLQDYGVLCAGSNISGEREIACGGFVGVL